MMLLELLEYENTTQQICSRVFPQIPFTSRRTHLSMYLWVDEDKVIQGQYDLVWTPEKLVVQDTLPARVGESQLPVLGCALGVTEVTFPALTVLCFALVAEWGLIPDQCFGCCQAAVSFWHSFPSPKRMGVGKILRGNKTRAADPNKLKGYFIPHDISLDI